MKSPEPRYRLRNGREVVGYMRKVANSMVMYSRDSFWWTGNKLQYKEVDEWIGLRDKNGRAIYEWDILYYKIDPDGEDQTGVVLWQSRDEVFGICDIHSEVFIPLTVNDIGMFNPRQLKVFSYLFINPELQKKLGVEE
jgi:hypothetical protein